MQGHIAALADLKGCAIKTALPSFEWADLVRWVFLAPGFAGDPYGERWRAFFDRRVHATGLLYPSDVGPWPSLLVDTADGIVLGVDGVPSGHRHPNGAPVGMSVLWLRRENQQTLLEAYRDFVSPDNGNVGRYAGVFRRLWEGARLEYEKAACCNTETAQQPDTLNSNAPAGHIDQGAASDCEKGTRSRLRRFLLSVVSPAPVGRIDVSSARTHVRILSARPDSPFVALFVPSQSPGALLDLIEDVARLGRPVGNLRLLVGTDDERISGAGTRTYKPASFAQLLAATLAVCACALATTAAHLVTGVVVLVLLSALCARQLWAIRNDLLVRENARRLLSSSWRSAKKPWAALLSLGVAACLTTLTLHRAVMWYVVVFLLALTHAVLASAALVSKDSLTTLNTGPRLISAAAWPGFVGWSLMWLSVSAAGDLNHMLSAPTTLPIALTFFACATTASIAARTNPRLGAIITYGAVVLTPVLG